MFKRSLTIWVSDLIIDSLRVSFRIEKSLVGFPNLANIKIYNLSESSRTKIEEKDLDIRIFAGYEDDGAPLIFSGQIINVVHQKIGVDWVSEIYAGDSITVINSATINKTLSPGATTQQIFDELITNLHGVTKGITEGIEDCLSGKRSLLRSLQLSGNVKDWLDKIAKDCGFEYSVNDGVIETTQEGFALDDEEAFIINQNSGMIGSPERTELGVTVKNLLLPNLKLGRKIQIKSISTAINIGNLFFREIPPIRNEGIYRIDKLIHSGDTHDNPWETQIIARNL